MINIKSTSENFNSEFTKEEREKISEAVNILASIADEMIITIGKRYENEEKNMKSKTTACIFCTDKYKLAVAERLIREVKDSLI
jgi:predicted ATP-grasp superfamily ATP-dependent carboligase